MNTKASSPPSAAASSPALQPAAVDEMVDGEGGAGFVARQQVAHVVGDARQALEPGLAVEQVGDLVGAHAALLDQIEHDAGIELARPRAHRQAVERGEAHRALDAPPVAQRAHRGAAAEMRDDDPAAGDRRAPPRAAARRHIRRTGRGSRSAARPRRRARAAARSSRRAPDGRGGRRCRSRRPAAGPGRSPCASRIGARLFGWCSGASGSSAVEPLEHAGIDQHRPGVIGPAMHDAVADRPQFEAAEAREPARAAPPIAAGRSGSVRRREAPVDQRRPVRRRWP